MYWDQECQIKEFGPYSVDRGLKIDVEMIEAGQLKRSPL